MEAVPVRRTRSQARKEQQQEEEVILAVDLQIDPIAAEEHAKLGWRRRGVPGKRRTAASRRRPLADVTNDSPIAGMCKGSPAAAMAIAKNKSAAVVLEEEEAGESLLRSQVQSLLETKLVDPCKVTSFVYSSPCSDHGGPTPANTPAGGAAAAAAGMITIAIHDPAEEEDDQSSNWSVDVNVSSPQKSVEEEEEEPVIQKDGKANPSRPNPWAMRDRTSKLVDPEFEDDGAIDQSPGAEKEEEFDEEEEDEVVDDELCRGVSGICVSKKPLFAQFAGKHIRYKYNSDDELLEEDVIDPPSPPPVAEPSPSITKLNGVPIAAGKHLRFQDP